MFAYVRRMFTGRHYYLHCISRKSGFKESLSAVQTFMLLASNGPNADAAAKKLTFGPWEWRRSRVVLGTNRPVITLDDF